MLKKMQNSFLVFFIADFKKMGLKQELSVNQTLASISKHK